MVEARQLAADRLRPVCGGALTGNRFWGCKKAESRIQWFCSYHFWYLILHRPLVVLHEQLLVPKTNVNSLIGERAVVIQKINNLEQSGQVRINDIEWMARTSSDEVTIPEHAIVTIEDVQGVKLIVKEETEGK